MTRYNVFFEYAGEGTDWAAIYADSDAEARRKFKDKYEDNRRILRVEAEIELERRGG